MSDALCKDPRVRAHAQSEAGKALVSYEILDSDRPPSSQA